LSKQPVNLQLLRVFGLIAFSGNKTYPNWWLVVDGI